MATRQRRQAIRLGDIAAVPLKDGSWSVAQVTGLVEEMECALVSFYSYRTLDTAIEGKSWPLNSSDLVAVQIVPVFPMRRGYWPLLGNVPPKVHDGSPDLAALESVGYVGMRIPDANTMQAVMNAYHGMAPWVIGTDKSYLTSLTVRSLQSGLPSESNGIS